MSIKSAERSLLLLEYIAKNQPITMRDLRQQLDIPRSSLHGLLGVLQDFGFLTVGPQGEYSIGLRAFEIGSAWAQSVNVESAALPVLRRLVDEVKQIAHIGVLDGTDIVYIMKQENARPVRLVSAVGKRIPAHATALGKVLMTPLSPEAIRARYPSGQLPQMTGATIVKVDDLVAAVQVVRRTGLCIDEGESTPGVTCFAAPIHGRQQDLLAALSVSVIESDPDIREKAYYADAVTRAAAEISASLGAKGGGR